MQPSFPGPVHVAGSSLLFKNIVAERSGQWSCDPSGGVRTECPSAARGRSSARAPVRFPHEFREASVADRDCAALAPEPESCSLTSRPRPRCVGASADPETSSKRFSKDRSSRISSSRTTSAWCGNGGPCRRSCTLVGSSRGRERPSCSPIRCTRTRKALSPPSPYPIRSDAGHGIILPGDVRDPSPPPAGCRFHTRATPSFRIAGGVRGCGGDRGIPVRSLSKSGSVGSPAVEEVTIRGDEVLLLRYPSRPPSRHRLRVRRS